MRLLWRFRRLPLTIRVPATVALLMVVISAIVSERVLDRLATTQGNYLQGLAYAYLDGIVASIIPSVLREDNWEVFDAVARMTPKSSPLRPVETVVTGKSGLVIASSDPLVRQTLSVLDPGFESLFSDGRVFIDESAGQGYARRAIAYQGQTIGQVHAVFDVSPLLEERRQVLVTLLLTNGMVTLSLGLIGFWAVGRMIRPMQVLETHMAEASAGSARLINESEYSGANREAMRMFAAFNGLVRSEAERQALTVRLAEEERLASLGRLASAMAHEINNPLGGLMNAVDTLRAHGDKRQVRAGSIDLIQRGLQGIREVVQATLATYRSEPLNRPLTGQDFIDLKLLMRPEMRRRQQSMDCRVAAMPDGAPKWPAGPVRQAVLNLLLNAAAVTPKGGRVGLAVRPEEGGLMVEISDQGDGMPETAKILLTGCRTGDLPVEGDGLGLWIVRQIADELEGTIAVSSGSPAHTVVRLFIPAPGPDKSLSRMEISHAA